MRILHHHLHFLRNFRNLRNHHSILFLFLELNFDFDLAVLVVFDLFDFLAYQLSNYYHNINKDQSNYQLQIPRLLLYLLNNIHFL